MSINHRSLPSALLLTALLNSTAFAIPADVNGDGKIGIEDAVINLHAISTNDGHPTSLNDAIFGLQITAGLTPLSGAFNTFDESTFSGGSCLPLPMVTPVGIFASPSGNPTAAGTKNDPLDLSTALANNGIVSAGTTLWLLEGTYYGSFESELRGSETAPIHVRPYPGKRVIIDTTTSANGSGLTIYGNWTNFYGLEVTSHNNGRVSTVDNSSNPSDITLNGGIDVISSTNRIINFISHDNTSGINAWSKRQDGFTGVDTELYGNVIYNNGWSAQPADGSYGRGHGHAIYAQNFDGTKEITNNIIFFGFGTGIHAYQTGNQNNRGIENFDIQHNTWFLTGASDIRHGMKKYDCLVGGYQPVRNLKINNNQGYSDIGRTMIGYASSYHDVNFTNENAELSNNYLVENFKVNGDWETISMMNNSIFHGISGNSQLINDISGNLFTSSHPTQGKKIFYTKNKYDQRRGRVTIYNFDLDDNVSIDLSEIVKQGAVYRIHSIFDLFGRPIVSGIYSGENVSIPMGTVVPPQPHGLDGAINADEGDDPGKLFGVFIVTHSGC